MTIDKVTVFSHESAYMLTGDFFETIGESCAKVLGQDLAENPTERKHRALEEVLEFVMAGPEGLGAATCTRLLNYVVHKNPQTGDPAKEAGNAMVALTAAAYSQGIFIFGEAIDDITLSAAMGDYVRNRHLAKPAHLKDLTLPDPYGFLVNSQSLLDYAALLEQKIRGLRQELAEARDALSTRP